MFTAKCARTARREGLDGEAVSSDLAYPGNQPVNGAAPETRCGTAAPRSIILQPGRPELETWAVATGAFLPGLIAARQQVTESLAPIWAQQERIAAAKVSPPPTVS